MFIPPNVPNILPRICCNRTGPSTLRWKVYAVKVVKLCEVLGLTNFAEWIDLRGPRRNARDSIGVILAVSAFAVVVLGGVVGVVLLVAKVPFHAVLLGGVCKAVKMASAYFLSLGVIAFIGAFILHKTQPSYQEYQAYIWRSINGWLDNNELDKVYRVLPLLDLNQPQDGRQARRTLVERLVDSGCTDLIFFDRLTLNMSHNDQDACYERIAKKIYEKDQDVKAVLSILVAHIHNQAKRDELLQYYAELQIEEGEILHVSTQEALSDLGLPRGIPELVTEYVGSPQLEMALMFANGIQGAQRVPDREQMLSHLTQFYLRNYRFCMASDYHLSKASVVFDQFLGEVNGLVVSGVVVPDADHVEYRHLLHALGHNRDNARGANYRLFVEQDLINALRVAGQARQAALVA